MSSRDWLRVTSLATRKERTGRRSQPEGRCATEGICATTLSAENGTGDPFWGDAPALFAFTQGLAENQYRPELFTATPGNLLAGRNVTAIALQVPDVTFGGTDVAV